MAPALTWWPSDDTEFNLSLEYLNYDFYYDSGIPAFGNRVANVPISRKYDQPGLPADNRENILVDFNWSHRFSDAWKFQNGVVSSSLKQTFNELYSFGPGNNATTLTRETWFGRTDVDVLNRFAIDLFTNLQADALAVFQPDGPAFFTEHGKACP